MKKSLIYIILLLSSISIIAESAAVLEGINSRQVIFINEGKAYISLENKVNVNNFKYIIDKPIFNKWDGSQKDDILKDINAVASGLKALESTTSEKFNNIISVAAGHGFALFLTKDGYVFSYGEGPEGQLGHGKFCKVGAPARLQDIKDAKAIGAGLNHSVILLNDGRVFIFGHFPNFDEKEQRKIYKPTQLQDLPPIQEIATGDNYTLMLDSEGGVWIFGKAFGDEAGKNYAVPRKINAHGELTIGKVKKILSSKNHIMLLEENGILHLFGQQIFSEKRFENVADIATTRSGDCMIFIFEDGKIQTYNNWNQFAMQLRDVPKELAGVTAIEAGEHHLLLKTGEGNTYRLHKGENCDLIAIPVACAQQFTAAGNHSFYRTKQGKWKYFILSPAISDNNNPYYELSRAGPLGIEGEVQPLSDQKPLQQEGVNEENLPLPSSNPEENKGSPHGEGRDSSPPVVVKQQPNNQPDDDVQNADEQVKESKWVLSNYFWGTYTYLYSTVHSFYNYIARLFAM